ncbi:MAG: type II toxin-antitoxin system VapC family toxin [Acidobacteria bacterium]|nr:type II toxin-antitoxin system VapC family toxin [Acidobacteriota bacterium]
MGYLLDTNVPSELMRKTASERVVNWLQRHEQDAFLSTVTLGEIRNGIALTNDDRKRDILDLWLRGRIYPTFANRILPVTAPIAERWGEVQAQRQRAGVILGVPDGLIAATAIEHGLTLVTRNVRDFQNLGLPAIVNPWE